MSHGAISPALGLEEWPNNNNRGGKNEQIKRTNSREGNTHNGKNNKNERENTGKKYTQDTKPLTNISQLHSKTLVPTTFVLRFHHMYWSRSVANNKYVEAYNTRQSLVPSGQRQQGGNILNFSAPACTAPALMFSTSRVAPLMERASQSCFCSGPRTTASVAPELIDIHATVTKKNKKTNGQGK